MGIKYLHIEAYKGVVNKSLDDLGHVNILVGDNNTCKTTFLQAVKLVFSEDKRGAIYDLAQWKIDEQINISFFESLLSFFNDYSNGLIRIESDLDEFYLHNSLETTHDGLRKLLLSFDGFDSFIISQNSRGTIKGRMIKPTETVNFIHALKKTNVLRNHTKFASQLLNTKYVILTL